MIFNEEERRQEATLWENRLVKTCTICNGTGSIPSDTGLHKMCECMQKAKLNTYLVSWGLPRKYLSEDWTWDKCVKRPFVTKCKDYSDNFISNYNNGKGIYLYGSQGRGKSTMEVLIAKDIVRKMNPDTGKPFVVAFSLYDDLVRMSYGSNNREALIKIYQKPQLLIIDNIGSETGLNTESKSAVHLLDNILRTRDNACYPTIISSNFHPDELKKIYNDPIHDLVVRNCDIVSVTGDNLRRKGEDDIDI